MVRWSGVIALAILALFQAGCQQATPVTEGAGTDAAKPPYRTSGEEGMLTGQVGFTGEAPAPRRIDMGSDEACLENNPDPKAENLVAAGGHLANVFVYVRSGDALDEYSFEPPGQPAVLDQKGCRYVPHVLGIQAGQVLEVTNSDPTSHNIHPSPKSNREWNMSQLAGAAPIREKFAVPETLIPVRCNQHPWMKAWIGVLAHPFFSVTSSDGTYTIRGLPPGRYTVAAWQEELGEQVADVTIPPRGTANLNFQFNSGTAYAVSALSLEPAIMLH